MSEEIFVVTSKVKKYIKASADLKCSASFISALSQKIQKDCDSAIRHAQQNKRKTVLDKDLF